MLLYVALSATLNLCIGYALGVYFGELPGMPRRRPAELPEPEIDLMAPTPAPAAAPAPAEPAKPAADTASTPHATESQPATPAVAEKPAEETKPAATQGPADVMQGLSAFQEQLAKLGAEMKAADNDKSFDDCAGRLQDANHEYLEKANSTLEELDDDPENTQATTCREVLKENAERVEEATGEIDSLLANGELDDAGRAKIIGQASALKESVESASQRLEEASNSTDPTAQADPAAAEATEPPAPDTTEADNAAANPPAKPPAGVLSSLDAVMEKIDEALADSVDHVVIASVRRDPLTLPEGQDAAEVENQLLATIGEMLDEILDPTHTAATQAGDQILMVLTGDSVEQATSRVEHLRQLVEQTTFTAAGSKLDATITCALAEAPDGASRDQLLEYASEALAEADRHGVNRSYHHDGRFPAPVMPEEVKVEKRSVALTQ